MISESEIPSFLKTSIGFSEVINFLRAIPETMEFSLMAHDTPVTHCMRARTVLFTRAAKNPDLLAQIDRSLGWRVETTLAKALLTLRNVAEIHYRRKFILSIYLPELGVTLVESRIQFTAAGLLEYLRMVQGSDPIAIAKNFLDRL